MLEENNQTPKVSVTVVTFNHGKWLAECLESIVTQQTNFPFEIIVGDDASTDGITQEILRDYADRYPHLIVPVFREKNINGTQNFLDVLRRTKGMYIAHIDGDDLMLPGKLQKQADLLDNRPECAMVTHLMRWINFKGEVIKDELHLPELFDINYLVESSNCVSSSARIFRRTAVLTWEAALCERVVDFRQNIEIAFSGLICCINENLGVYRYGVGVTSPYIHTGFLPDLIQQSFLIAKRLNVSNKSISIGNYRYKYEILMWCLRNDVIPPKNIIKVHFPLYGIIKPTLLICYSCFYSVLGGRITFSVFKSIRRLFKTIC